MTLVIELPPELERQLQEEAARRGQHPAEFARTILETQVEAAALRARERARRISTLMEQWNAEDSTHPDPDPLWEITPLSLWEAKVD
jgi:hypothetical protein